MEFPDSYPINIWVIMGTLGCASSIIFSIYMWKWMKSGQANTKSTPFSNFTFIGMCFLFASGLFACGIAGPPGYALSSNAALVSKEWIFRASYMSNMFATIGWALVLTGQIKTIKSINKQP